MNILIITLFYAPDIGPSAPLFTLLSEALVKRGHRVRVIAAVPHYAAGKVPADFRKVQLKPSIENGVEVIRVPVPSVDRTKFGQRIRQFISFQFWSTLASMFHKYDVALVTNPAIETWLPAIWHAVIRCKPMVYSVFDVYPDVGIKLGVFRSRAVIKAVASLERSCLKPAVKVQIISENFRPGLRALGVSNDKMALIDVWVDTDLIYPLPADNAFSREYGLADKFVVLYAGNIGLSQGLEHVLTAAQLLAGNTNLRFVFVGAGAGLEKLKQQAHQRQLSDVVFIPFQPRKRLPEVLASASISLVILRKGIGADSLPSKTYSILASGRPIVASVDEESEVWKLVERAEAGLCVPSEDPEGLARAILKIKNDKGLRDRLGSHARLYAEKHHSVSSAAEQFEELFRKTIASK